jgi:hypothetical protein
VFAKPAILLLQAGAIWEHAASQSFVSPAGPDHRFTGESEGGIDRLTCALAIIDELD